MNAHLRNALTYRFAVAEVSTLRPVNPRLNPQPALPIAQRGKPFVEYRRCENDLHKTYCILFFTIAHMPVMIVAAMRAVLDELFARSVRTGRRSAYAR